MSPTRMRRYGGRRKNPMSDIGLRKRVAETYFAKCYENLTRGRTNSTVAKIQVQTRARVLTKMPNVHDGVWKMFFFFFTFPTVSRIEERNNSLANREYVSVTLPASSVRFGVSVPAWDGSFIPAAINHEMSRTAY